VNRGIVTVVGGPHPTALPEEMTAQEAIDFLVLGEGEITLWELVTALEVGSKDFRDINGLAYQKDKEIVITKPREVIKDLDILPFPARDLLQLDLYYPPPTKRVSDKRPTSMITGRGCPYSCNFCIAQLMWGKKVRVRSVKNVADEIEECITRYGLAEFNFHDELFTLSEKHVIEMCQEMKRRNLDIAWHANARTDSLTRKMLKEMKEAGCREISFGFESGSQKILNNIKKKTTVEKAYEAVQLTNEAGIRAGGTFMIGNLGEREETIRLTIDLAKRLDLHTAIFMVATPYPGTELYRVAKDRGYLRKGSTWVEYAPIINKLPPLNLPNLSSEQLLAWRKRGYREFYLRPSYLWRFIKKMRSFADFKNLLRGAILYFRVK
jgi:anaerobic magnesium-protoporphyrin IX monomethyl ester cyclase